MKDGLLDGAPPGTVHLVIQEGGCKQNFCRVDEPFCALCETYETATCSLVAI